MAPDAITPNGSLFFEDLRVGQRFHSSTYQLTAEEIKEFARQFDPQPFHLDEESARSSLFQGLVASGWHTAALTMRLWVTCGWPISGGLIGAGGEITWSRPVRPGDVLHIEGEVLELRGSRSRPGRGFATVRTKTLNQNDEAVQIMTARIVVPRRPESSGGT